MSLEKYKKIDIACAQLDQALRLYFEGKDYFSVITLAGAAEEILGRIVELRGGESSLTNIVKNTSLVHKHLYGVELPHKQARWRANLAKNSIKHLDSEQDMNIEIDLEEEANDILVRATDNHWALQLPESEMVWKFQDYYREYVIGV